MKNLPQVAKLKVCGNQLTTASGDPVMLHGVSFGWHNWWPRFYNESAVHEFKTEWHCHVLRAAMGVEHEAGFIKQKKASEKLITGVVDACIREGMYVIIDWHCHFRREKEAISFFTAMAKRYAGVPNVIYEIFNEPVRQSWKTLRAYAQQVINAIRKYDPENIILVGTPHWDQDLNACMKDPLIEFDNIMYTLHFYAGAHKASLRRSAAIAIDAGLPVFVSECGGMESNGNGPLHRKEWHRWLDWMDQRKISWLAWSVADKNETCSMLYPSAASTGGWKEDDIKPWGKMVRDCLVKY